MVSKWERACVSAVESVDDEAEREEDEDEMAGDESLEEGMMETFLGEDNVDVAVPNTSSSMAAEEEVVMEVVAGVEGFFETGPVAVEHGGEGEDEKGAVNEEGVGVVGLGVETDIVLVL